MVLWFAHYVILMNCEITQAARAQQWKDLGLMDGYQVSSNCPVKSNVLGSGKNWRSGSSRNLWKVNSGDSYWQDRFIQCFVHWIFSTTSANSASTCTQIHFLSQLADRAPVYRWLKVYPELPWCVQANQRVRILGALFMFSSLVLLPKKQGDLSTLHLSDPGSVSSEKLELHSVALSCMPLICESESGNLLSNSTRSTWYQGPEGQTLRRIAHMRRAFEEGELQKYPTNTRPGLAIIHYSHGCSQIPPGKRTQVSGDVKCARCCCMN